jgi:nitrate reductase delta subunit
MASLTMSEYENALRARYGGARRLPGIGSRKSSDHALALERVRQWTRERFKLADDVPILVAEIACGLPGCPPLETVVAFWTAADRRHQFKLFKQVAEVVRDDLPYAWLIDALVASEIPDCC